MEERKEKEGGMTAVRLEQAMNKSLATEASFEEKEVEGSEKVNVKETESEASSKYIPPPYPHSPFFSVDVSVDALHDMNFVLMREMEQDSGRKRESAPPLTPFETTDVKEEPDIVKVNEGL
jgi:hypothetical protein